MALTLEQKVELRKIISESNPKIEQLLEKFAAMTDEEVLAEIAAAKAKKLEILNIQKQRIEAKIAELT